jgi:VIT1/CCC1 family predicted Fe2+/Mn2+ transporter
MSATTTATTDESEERFEPVLDTVERVSEMCFGLFMALTFVGAVNAATAGQDPGRVLLYTALGCNLAWGLVDAVMYLVRTITTRGKRLTLALAVRAADPAGGVRLVRDSLPPLMSHLVDDAQLEAIRERLVQHAPLPDRPRLHGRDFLGALGIFVIVVLSTFPVALPFIVFDDIPRALLVSRVLTIVMLFGAGAALGKFAGYGGWKTGTAMVVLGIVLTMAVIALGG